VVFAGRRADLLDAAVTCNGRGGAALPGGAHRRARSRIGPARCLRPRSNGSAGSTCCSTHAGIGTPPIPMEDLPFEQWKSVVETNLNGAFLCTQEAIRLMKAQTPRGGRIITTDRSRRHAPRPHSVAYTATKHAITGLTRSTSLDGRAHDIACQPDRHRQRGDRADRAHAARRACRRTVKVAAEPTIDTAHVGRAVVYMANLPLDTQTCSS